MLFQVNYFLSEKSIINTHQHGFRQNKSTESLLFELHDRIRNTLNDGKLAIIISLDLSKAFDTLNHFQLINQLRDVGFSIKAQKLILGYRCERVVQISINNVRSRPIKTLSGVPQGSILGPTLFNICINDFISMVVNKDVFQYADDCQILQSTLHRNGQKLIIYV